MLKWYDITNRRKAEKSKTMWQLTSTTLNNQQKRKIKKEIRKDSQQNENIKTAHGDLCKTVRAGLRAEFLLQNAYTENKRALKSVTPASALRKIGKEMQISPK